MVASQVTMVGWPQRGAQLDAIAQQVQEALNRAAVDLSDELRVVAVDESPIGTSDREGARFRDSWVSTPEPGYQGGARVVLGNTAPHASYVIDPTSRHPIAAAHVFTTKTGKKMQGFLRFEIGGEVFYRHEVMHPGTKGNDVPGRVNQRMQPTYAAVANDLGIQVTSQVARVFQ